MIFLVKNTIMEMRLEEEKKNIEKNRKGCEKIILIIKINELLFSCGVVVDRYKQAEHKAI